MLLVRLTCYSSLFLLVGTQYVVLVDVVGEVVSRMVRTTDWNTGREGYSFKNAQENGSRFDDVPVRRSVVGREDWDGMAGWMVQGYDSPGRAGQGGGQQAQEKNLGERAATVPSTSQCIFFFPWCSVMQRQNGEIALVVWA